MRALLALAFLLPVVAGCVPPIPVKDDFGATTVLALGDIPPDFTGLNSFDPAANAYIADQICATPFQRLHLKTIEAVPGSFEQLVTRCRTHVPLFGS